NQLKAGGGSRLRDFLQLILTVIAMASCCERYRGHFSAWIRCTLYSFTRFSRRGDTVSDMNTPDDQHVIFKLSFPSHVGCQVLITPLSLGRFQRAPKGSQALKSLRRDSPIDKEDDDIS